MQNLNNNFIQNFEFNLRTKTKAGLGEALNLGKYLKEMSLKKIGLIIDAKIAKLDYTQKILDSVKKEKFDKMKIWEYDLNSEPDYDSLDRIKLLFTDSQGNSLVDCFVGIGGGSVIDFAKGLATLATNSGKAISFRGFPIDINSSLPTIVLPTTAGTGSEVTFNAVFIDKNENKKLGINTRNNFPALAILDPELTLSCPLKVSVSSGIDAMVHALEGYMSKKSDILTKMFAKESFRLMFRNLPKIKNEISPKFLKNPKDVETRMNLQIGAYLGGLVLLGSGGGPTGALSYSLGVNFKVPHGLAGGVFLPYIVEHNVKKGYDFGELYDAIENNGKAFNKVSLFCRLHPRRQNKKQKNALFCKKIFQLWKKLEVPNNLKSFGVDKENINILLKETENYEKAFLQNPIPFLVEDGKKLIMKLLTNN